MTNLIVRIDLGEAGRIGPGKILLLEMIAEHGSISAAGRAMSLPYRHAWELVEQLNATFREPVVMRQTGGRNGGGAALTPFGTSLLEQLVALRNETEKVAAARLSAIDAALRKEVSEPAAVAKPSTSAGEARGGRTNAAVRSRQRDSE